MRSPFTKKTGIFLATLFFGFTAAVQAFDSYQIDIPPNVMKGDPDVFFTVTPYIGAVPDLAPHNIYIDLPAGILESPLANPPAGLDWSSIVNWGLFANNAVAAGNVPITVTEAFAGVPVTTTKFFNLQNVVRSFEIVPPPLFAGQVGVPFVITVRAKDGLGGAGGLVSGFNDSVLVSASTGDVVVNGVGNIVNGADFVNGEATVSVMLRGTDPNTRINRIIVTASINYFNLGLATGFADVSLDPGPYDRVVLLFPGETLAPGRILIASGKIGAASDATANIAVPNVTAYLVDQFNNPIITPLAPVTLAFESLSYPLFPRPPNDTVPGLKVINAGNNTLLGGDFVFYRANEFHQVRAYDFNDALKNSVSSVFVNSGAPNLIKIEPNIATPQVPGQAFIVSARVVDGTPAENTVVIYNGPVSVVLTNCGGISYPLGSLDTNPGLAGVQTTVAFVNGEFTGPLQVFPRANPVCLKFDDGAGRFGESNAFQIIYGDQLRLHVVLPGQAFTPGQMPGNAPSVPTIRSAGDVVSAQVYVVDQGWNVINSVTGGWAPGPVVITIEDGAGAPGFVDLAGAPPNMPPSGAFANVPGITLRTAYPAGNGRLVARMSGLEGQSDAWTINPTAYSRMVFVAPGETLAPGILPASEPDGKTGLPNSQTVSLTFPVRVYLTDNYFNPILNPPLAGGLWPQITFSLTAPAGGSITIPFANPFQMVSGTFNNQLTLGTLGANVIRVVDNSPAPKSVNQTINVEPGVVTRFVVTPNPASNVADPIPIQTVGAPFILTFKAFDQFDNIATNFDGPARVELWENGAPLAYDGAISPSTIDFVADPVTGGVVTTPVTITYAGQSLGNGPDQLQVRVFVSTPVLREGFSAFFSVKELLVWSDIVVTLPGESRRPGLGPAVLKTGVPNPVVAGNAFPVTVTAVDFYGNRLDQATLANLSIPTAGVFANLGSPAQVTVDNGQGVGFVQVYTAGTATLQASVISQGFVNSSTMTINRGSYAAGTGRLVLLAPGEVLIPGSPSAPGKDSAGINTIQANTAMSYTLVACDRFYNMDTTYSGNTFSLASNDGAISLSNLSVNSGSGTVSNVFLRGILPNPSVVRVTATDQADVNKTSFADVPVSPGAAYNIVVPPLALAGQNFPMTVELLDPNTGLPMAGANNSITLEAITTIGGPATVPLGVTLVNLVNGTVSFDQSYGYVETIKIRVTDSFNRLSESGNIDVTPNGLKYIVNLPPAAKTTDDIFSVTVGLYDTIQDALPIRDSSYQHTFGISVEAGGLPAVGSSPVSEATLTDGVASFNFSYTKAEHIVVRATGNVAGFLNIFGVDDMDINPGAYVKVQILAPGEVPIPGIPSLTGKDSSGLVPQAARESFSLTVNAVDRYWNMVTSLNTPLAPSLRLTASDGSLASFPLQSFANGQSLFAGVRLNSPPQVTVTAQDTSSVSLFPQSVVIPLTGRLYVADVASNFPPDFYSGPPRDFDVTLSLFRYDGASTGPLVSGFTGKIHIEPFTPSLQPLPVQNLVIINPPLPDLNEPNMVRMDPSGLLNLTLAYRVAEDVIFRFRDEDGWQGFSAPIHFIPREVDYVVTTPAESPVGPPTTFSMTVSPRDRDTGTEVKNWSEAVTITPMSPAALPVTGVLQVNNLLLSNGGSTFQQAFSQAGVFYFQVTDGVRISTSASMNFTPGPLASLVTDLPASLEAGTTQQIRVTLMDAFSNPIPNLPVTYALTDASFGTLSTLNGVSNVQGQASTLYVSNAQKSGNGEFRAASGSINVRQFFRLLGPPLTTLRVGGLGVDEEKGFAIKPGDPIYLDVQVEPGSNLLSLSYSVDGGPFLAYAGPFVINEVGRHTIQYYGVTQSGVVHTETVKTSKTLFVSAATTVEEGLVNYPNPFRAGRDLTYLEYHLSDDSGVRLTVYDLLGQKVREQIYSQGEGGGQVGLNRISWDGRNDDGVAVGNGGYVVVLDIAAEGRKMKRKVAVIK